MFTYICHRIFLGPESFREQRPGLPPVRDDVITKCHLPESSPSGCLDLTRGPARQPCASRGDRKKRRLGYFRRKPPSSLIDLDFHFAVTPSWKRRKRPPVIGRLLDRLAVSLKPIDQGYRRGAAKWQKRCYPCPRTPVILDSGLYTHWL